MQYKNRCERGGGAHRHTHTRARGTGRAGAAVLIVVLQETKVGAAVGSKNGAKQNGHSFVVWRPGAKGAAAG